MASFIPVPREALAELLRTSGSALTPEQFVSSLSREGGYRKFSSRAWTAALSKRILVVVTILAAVCLPFNLDSVGSALENVIVAGGLGAVTFFEYRTHRYFLEGNPAGCDLGFINESCFAAAILVYGLYHAILPSPMPEEMRGMVDPSLLEWMQGIIRMGYVIVGVVGALSQFGLAWYYRSAKAKSV